MTLDQHPADTVTAAHFAPWVEWRLEPCRRGRTLVVALNTITDYEDRSASGDGSQAVVGAAGTGADVLAARELLQADRDRLTAAVGKHWEELTDPATPSSRLFELAGLDAPQASPTATAVASDGVRTCS